MDWKSGRKKLVTSFSPSSIFVSWSPHHNVGLFLNFNSPNGAKGASYTLIDAVTGTCTTISSERNRKILAAFWSRNGEEVVFTAGTGDLTHYDPEFINNHTTEQFFGVHLAFGKQGLTTSPVHLMTDREVDASVGTALRPLIKMYETEEATHTHGSRYTFRDVPIGISASGDKAITFRMDVEFRGTWGDKPVYVVQNRHAYHWLLRGAACDPVDRGPYWSQDERWVNYFINGTWVWLNMATHKEVIVASDYAAGGKKKLTYNLVSDDYLPNSVRKR
jgi:hypothetical protein